MKTKFLLLAVLTLALFACQTENEDIFLEDSTSFKKIDKKSNGEGIVIDVNYIEDINNNLISKGSNLRLSTVEYITNGEDQAVGQTIYSKITGNKQLGHDFVPFDPRRVWSGPSDGDSDDITYSITTHSIASVPVLGGLTGAQTDEAIENAMTTWKDVKCSDMGLNRIDDGGQITGMIMGGSIIADIMHGGFYVNYAGGILGVTHTFIFVDGSGPTDIDNNGKIDVAFREIYYDYNHTWSTDGSAIDLESVAVHETGHGLSQAHFGSVAVLHPGTPKARLRVSPRAVMNALYTGTYRDLGGSDNGGHCSNWAQWPNN